MGLIKGTNSITSLNISGVFYPIFCAKNFVFTLNQEEVEVTNIGSGADRDFLPGLGDGSISVDGLMELDNSDGRISILYLMQQSIRRKVHQLRTTFTDDDGNVQVLTYYAFYRVGSATKQTGFYNTNAAEFRVTGVISFSSSVTPPVDPVCEVQETLALTLAEDATTVTSASLTTANAEVLWVSREGILYTLTTGTPGNREYAIDYGTGTITFLAPGNPGGEGVEVGWQITA